MNTRLELQETLENILGSRNVYFQPPENLKLNYPAIVYNRSELRNTHGDNLIYAQRWAFDITVIDADPDSDIINGVSKIPKCRYNRHFVSDNLNHDVFTVYLD